MRGPHGDTQRFLSLGFERRYAKLYECHHFSAVALAVRWIFSSCFRERAEDYCSCVWDNWRTSLRTAASRVLRAKRRIREVQVDLSFNPAAKFSHGDGLGFAVLERGGNAAMLRETFPEISLLVFTLGAARFQKTPTRSSIFVAGKARQKYRCGWQDPVGERLCRCGHRVGESRWMTIVQAGISAPAEIRIGIFTTEGSVGSFYPAWEGRPRPAFQTSYSDSDS